MALYAQDGGAASLAPAETAVPGDWTIFPHGWPGPEPSFGIVRSVGERTALVHDVAFGMNVEFRLDLIELLTPARKAQMSAAERAALERAVRQANAGEGDRREDERRAA